MCRKNIRTLVWRCQYLLQTGLSSTLHRCLCPAIGLNSCGLLLHVASTDCLLLVPWPARPWLHRLLLSVISAFSSIKIWRCQLTCNGQHLAASPPYVSCAATDAACRRLFFSLWLLHWSSAVWIIVSLLFDLPAILIQRLSVTAKCLSVVECLRQTRSLYIQCLSPVNIGQNRLSTCDDDVLSAFFRSPV